MTEIDKEWERQLEILANKEVHAALRRIFLAGARAGNKTMMTLYHQRIEGLEAELKYWKNKAEGKNDQRKNHD